MKYKSISKIKFLLLFLILALFILNNALLFVQLNLIVKYVLIAFFSIFSLATFLVTNYWLNNFALISKDNFGLKKENEKLNKTLLAERDTNNQLQRINIELTVRKSENDGVLEELNKTMYALNLLNEKHAESNKELETQKQELFDLYHNAPCGYFTVDSSDKLISVNRTALKWIGYHSEDIFKKSKFESYLTESSKKLYLNAFETARQKGGFSGLLLYAIGKNGEEMPFVLNAFTLFDEDNQMKLLRCTCYDMRDRIKYEKEILEQKQKAEEANESKNKFLSKMSHDLRTPLHGIIGNISLLKQTAVSENQKTVLNDLNDSSEKMSEIVNDIFDMTIALDSSKKSDYSNHYILNNNLHIKKLDLDAKILIVDDEILNQKLLIGMLNQLKLKADTADNGKIAVEMYQKNKYDLIFMDILMPEMNGIDASSHIMKMDNKKPVIIAITANIIKYEKQKYVDAGIQVCLTKPTRFNDFVTAINPYFKLELKPESENVISNDSDDDFLDYTILTQIVETAQSIGNDFDKIMLAVAKKEIPTYAAKVSEYLENGNQKELIEMLHKLKGASWTSGMKKVGDMCREFENKVKENNLSIDVPQLVLLIDISLEKLDCFYNKKSVA